MTIELASNLSTENNNGCAPKRSVNKTIVRIVISAAILGLIFYKLVDRRALLQNLELLTTKGAISIILMYIAGQILSTIKWCIFVKQAELTRSFKTVLRAYFLGMFVNTFGLGTVGGDIARGLLLKPEKGKRTAALATVVADRVHGLTVLVCIGLVGVAFVRPPVLGNWAIAIAIAAVVCVTLGWLIGPKLLTTVFHNEHRWGQAAINAAKAFPAKPKPFLLATFVSCIFHFSQIFVHVMILNELNVHIELPYLLATVPFVNVISSLPISMNGIGVREGLYIFFFAPLGITNETAVAIGLLWLFTVTVISALCGIIFGTLYSLLSNDDFE